MLPVLFGLGGSALAGAGLIGMKPLLAGAIGSGLGSLAQGDDLGTALGTGIMSYFGGKALNSVLGGAAGSGVGTAAGTTSNLAANAAPVTAFTQPAVAPGSSAVAGTLAGNTAAGAGGSSILQTLTDPTVMGAIGTTALPSLLAPPQTNFSSMDDDYDIPEAEAAMRSQNTPGSGFRPGIDSEFNYFTPMREGGIAALKYEEGGEMNMAEQPNDKELINKAVDAIKGIDPNPQVALAQFISRYGEDALRDLVDRVNSGQFDEDAMVQEGMLNGVGDGMDDMIPATLEGEQDVVLSDGEFIVPADVVSGLGNGSSDAGADALYSMMDRVREMRTGMTEQPKQVPQMDMLPV